MKVHALRQIVLAQLRPVDIHIAALEGHCLPGQSHHPLHQHLTLLVVPERNDSAPLGHGVGHCIGQPPPHHQ